MNGEERGIASAPAPGVSRREGMALVAMGTGLVLAYGTLALQALLFLLPERIRPRTRRLFVGPIDSFAVGGVRTVRDLRGGEILIQRRADGFTAFSSVCPHLGCRVHWEAEKQRFFCPCHSGVFDPDGVATAGPPAAANQRLPQVPLEVDERSGVVYLEVAAPARRSRA